MELKGSIFNAKREDHEYGIEIHILLKYTNKKSKSIDRKFFLTALNQMLIEAMKDRDDNI